MNFSVDKYLDRQFNAQTYNCWSFVREVWADLTKSDLGHQTPESANNLICSLCRTPAPTDPCLVLLAKQNQEPHVGIYYQGRLLHLSKTGPEYRPLNQVTLLYKEVQYYVMHSNRCP